MGFVRNEAGTGAAPCLTSTLLKVFYQPLFQIANRFTFKAASRSTT
jgi:hypothetical protein